jgi:phosphoribosylformimino-5-aminoimidazole carboxamide ribotide isomerase
MQIIPAIDLIGGRCVRLTEGDYSQQTTYNANPVEVAKNFEQAGITRLHLVDLDGAKIGKIVNNKVLEDIAKATNLKIDFGGGIKSTEDVEKIFDHGASYASIGSVAVKQPDLFLAWVARFGADKMLLGADVRNEKIAINGWADHTEINIIDFIGNYVRAGITQIFCTDISKDGKLQGISTALYRKILTHFPHLHLIASGGVSSTADLQAAQEMGCKGIIVGKALYENRISLQELVTWAKVLSILIFANSFF